MAITIRIPERYAARIVSNIRNIPSGVRDPRAIERLNIQPDGSILVQTSADNQYDAVQEVFAQNLGIPFAAIRGFDSRITSKSEKGVSPEDIFGPNKSVLEIAPQDIAAPITGAGDLEDMAFQERRERGLVDIGPVAPFARPQILTPSFYRETEEAQGEGSSIAGLFDVAPDSVAAAAGVAPTLPAFTAAAGGDGLPAAVVPPVVPPVVPDSVTMPANLPPFWQERYNEYLTLPGSQQQAILDNQLQNYIELNEWQIDTGGATGEEGGGVSGAAGADLTLQELEALAAGGTTGGGAGRGFRFQPGAFTGAGNIPQPMNLQGFPVTGLQDMLNIFYSDPSQYIVEQDIIGTTGYDENGNPIEGVIGSQQSLSPAAQAALQAFSTQRGAESADLASRFGTSTPFGVFAGMGGKTAAADAKSLAELQAKAGVSNPYAALGTGETIEDIGTILRGGLDVDEQLALQRLGILPSLFQATPQALGGLSRVLGGEEALQRALSPFFGGVPAGQDDAQQGITQNISGFPFGGQPVNMNIAGSPFGGQPVSMNIADPPVTQQEVPRFRPTLGDYQGAGMFEQGGFQAEAGIAGQELPKFLGEVSPQGMSTARGGLGATTTGRFTF